MTPFRWTIAKREQLGTLVDLDKRVNLDRDGFFSNLREASARILTYADGADLAFIGRTPENFFDYLSGAFSDLADAPELHLVQFSLRWAGPNGIRSIEEGKLAGFFDYLAGEGIDPSSISMKSKPLALIDFVAQGGTMQNFIELLHLQAQRTETDWNAVQRRLRIIGLRVRTHNSPNTWRWQQHQDWLHIIPNTVIKNVSAPAQFLYHMANDQPKVTRSFHPGMWDRDVATANTLTDDQKEALGLAVRLYDKGRQREERTELAGLIAKSQGMRQGATRRLVSRLKGS